VSVWRATKAKRVYAALLRLGWTLKKQVWFPSKAATSWLSIYDSFLAGAEGLE
jgi:hypothetical protein